MLRLLLFTDAAVILHQRRFLTAAASSTTNMPIPRNSTHPPTHPTPATVLVSERAHPPSLLPGPLAALLLPRSGPPEDRLYTT